MRGGGWANEAPGAAKGRRWEERPGAMETQLHQQKFLTLECEGRSRISNITPTGRRRRAPSYFFHLLTLLPASEGRLLRAPTTAGFFLCVCRKKEGVGRLGAGELTCDLAGLGAWSAKEECLGLGDSMRGPWTERRSWHCPACARCGRPCSHCSPAEPKETGCEYGVSRGARVCGKSGAQPEGTFS